MAIGVVDHFEAVQVQQHDRDLAPAIGIVVVSQGHPVADPGQGVRLGHVLQKLVFLGQLDRQAVVGPGQIAKLVGAGLMDRPVGAYALHGPEHGIDAEAYRQPDKEQRPHNLQHDHRAHKMQDIAQLCQGFGFGIVRQCLQRVEAVLHVHADAFLLVIVLVVQHHLCRAAHLLLRGEGRILFAERHIPQLDRAVGIAPGLDHQAHGVVFPVHQIHRLLHGLLEPYKRVGKSRGAGHLFDGALAPVGLKRLGKILPQKAHVPVYREALHPLGQIVRCVHQLMRRLIHRNLVLGRLRQIAEGQRQSVGSVKHQPGEDKGPDHDPDIDCAKRDPVLLRFQHLLIFPFYRPYSPIQHHFIISISVCRKMSSLTSLPCVPRMGIENPSSVDEGFPLVTRTGLPACGRAASRLWSAPGAPFTPARFESRTNGYRKNPHPTMGVFPW